MGCLSAIVTAGLFFSDFRVCSCVFRGQSDCIDLFDRDGGGAISPARCVVHSNTAARLLRLQFAAINGKLASCESPGVNFG